MTALDFLPDLVAQLAKEGFYYDKVDILAAVEKNVSGRICREWEPVTDPCDESLRLIDVPCQFLFGRSKRGTGQQTSTVSDDRHEVVLEATADFPEWYPWLTEAMRIRHNGRLWRIVGIQNDLDAMTRAWLRDAVQ